MGVPIYNVDTSETDTQRLAIGARAETISRAMESQFGVGRECIMRLSLRVAELEAKAKTTQALIAELQHRALG